MNKRNQVIAVILIIINGIINYCIASNRWVNMMPYPSSENTFMEDFYELFIGKGFPTVLMAIITVVVLFMINKLIVKQELEPKKYVFLFAIVFIINIIIYRIGIGIAV